MKAQFLALIDRYLHVCGRNSRWTRLWDVTRALSNAGRGIGVAAALIIMVAIRYGLATLSGTTAPPATAASAAAEGFTDAKLAALRASGQPVFVDATAARCITCL